MPDPKETRIKALLAAIELYDGIAFERFLVYDKSAYRFFTPQRKLMLERRDALQDLLKDVRGQS